MFTSLNPLSIDNKQQYLAIGPGVQTCVLSGSVGIAVVHSLWVNHLLRHLESVLTEADIDTLLTDTKSLGGFFIAIREAFRVVCRDAHNLQMLATLGFAAAQVIVMAVLWRQPAYRVSKEGALM